MRPQPSSLAGIETQPCVTGYVRSCLDIRHVIQSDIQLTCIKAMQSARVGKRGAIVVPAKLRKRFGIEEGSIVIAEEKDDGILYSPRDGRPGRKI
jgi:AbrB family looped-hinge helix DNA binding protein